MSDESAASCPHTKRYYYYGVCEDCGAIRESAESNTGKPYSEILSILEYCDCTPVGVCLHEAAMNAIEDLQSDLETEKRKNQELEKLNQQYSNDIRRGVALDMYEKIAFLESSLDGMKKLNADTQELSDLRLRDLGKYMKQAYELEGKLKAAEDKLAAVTKEKEEYRQRGQKIAAQLMQLEMKERP